MISSCSFFYVRNEEESGIEKEKIMSKKLLVLMTVVVVVGTVCISTYLASAAPQGKGNDRVLTKIKFIHYRKPHGKPAGTPGGKPEGKGKDEGYYTYMAKGAKWKTIEPFLFNPTNYDGVTNLDVETAVSSGMGEWETYAPSDIFGNITEDYAIAGTLDLDVLQKVNTISFRDLGDQNANVIAWAIVWGYFGGPPSQREIIEAHIELNDRFEWGVVNPEKPVMVMDVQNILTHELGHCAGMGDLYLTDAIEETMYGYSDEGETNKRDLYKGDIAGISGLYK